MHLNPGGGQGNPLQYSCLENSMVRGAWRGTVHGVCKELDTTEWLSMDPHKNSLAHCYQGFPGGSDTNKSACNAGDMGSTLGQEDSPGEGKRLPIPRLPGGRNAKPIQYSCLESLMDRGAWRATVHGVRVWCNSTTNIHNASEILECWKGQEKRVKWRQEHGSESYYYCSATKSCPTVCDSMDSDMPGFSVLHYLL